MKSFRIIDTKFRILKGGKIGLAASIALIGGMLTLGNTAAKAVDYFTDVDTTAGAIVTLDNSLGGTAISPLDDNILTAETRSNNVSNKTDSRDHNGTSNENVVFKPTSFVKSTYTQDGSEIRNTSDATEYYVASTDEEKLSLTLTFDNGANANDITKGSMTEYSTGNGNDFTENANRLVELTQSSNTNYNANLIFKGTNYIGGNTHIEQGNINIKGAVTFVGTVEAGSIDINTTNNSVVFKDGVTLGNTTQNNLTFHKAGEVTLESDLVGNIYTDNDGMGTLIFTDADISNNFVVTGNIGTINHALGTVKAGEDSTTTYLNSTQTPDYDSTTTMSYIKTLQYTGNGSVVLNGRNGDNDIGGMVGTVDFGVNGTGELQIGDGVNLTTGTTGIQFANANDATMVFNGTSIVIGDLGGNTTGRSTFAEIIAGYSTESDVTFQGDVYTGSFVIGNESKVNVANGKSIISTSVLDGGDGDNILNYLGSTTLHSDIGDDVDSLSEVNFNTENNNITQTIDKNIYARTTTIGNTLGGSSLSLADVTGKYDYAGATSMKEWRGQTAANITKNITFSGDLVIADAKSAINFGTSQVSVDGDFITNHGGMSFTVNTKDISNDQSGVANSDGSAKVTVDGYLVMRGAEKIQINYVGSLKQAGTYELITANGSDGASYAGTEKNGLVSDNSFAIDTKVDLVDDSLVVSADRTSGGQESANALYIQKSKTKGDLSNNAAKALAGIAAAGSQTGDMVEVIQKMEIDSFGYGNSQANLETQVKKLAPIANASYSQAAIGANTLVNNTVSSRMADLRGDSTAGQTAGLSSGDEIARNGAWAKVIGSTATQKQDGMYDGYKTNSGGLAAGIDHQFKNDITAGLALGYTSTNIDQQDFRSGDSADTKSYNIVAYAGKDFENAYVEGALSYAMHNTQGSRATAVGRTAQSDIDANQYTAHTSAGYRFNIQDSATVTPFLALDYTHLTQDAYTETGAGAINLNVSELSTSRTTVGGGVKLGSKIESGSTTLTPELKLATYHISGGNDTDIAAQYVGGGEKFVTPGNDLNNMMYNIGLGLKAQISDNTTLGFAVDYDRSSDGLFEGYTGQVFGRIAF